MKIFKYIGIVCLAFWNGYYHPVQTKTDALMTVLFWVGITFFVKFDKEDE